MILISRLQGKSKSSRFFFFENYYMKRKKRMEIHGAWWFKVVVFYDVNVVKRLDKTCDA